MAKTLVLNGTNFSANKLATVTWGESIPCTGITLDESTKDVTSMMAFTLTATPTPANTTDEVYWTTSDDTVASVASGVVTPLKLGTVTITATCGEYSASCAVTIDNVVATFKAVAGYAPFRRSSSSTALTTGKATGTEGKSFILANDQASGLYPIESKTDVDTTPYRFVPILIPAGATKITITTTLGNIKTRSLYIDSTKVQTSVDTGIGAFCVYGGTSSDYDQGSTASTPITLNIPQNVDGLDSCCIAMVVNQNYTYGNDYTQYVNVVFSYGT